MKINLYNYLTLYGDCYETSHKMICPNQYVDWTENNFQYLRYNPRKPIERYGLSITSLDGKLTGIPDLDSLYEYNKENKTNYSERDFTTYTPVFNQELQEIFNPIKNYIFRSHILKLKPGGYFPPHRDFNGLNIDSFRLIVPLKNMNPPDFTFILNEKIQHWNYGSIYFVDTAKMHYLFNASFESCYMIVFNVDLNEKTVQFVTKNLKQR